jgi:hypothetical protein
MSAAPVKAVRTACPATAYIFVLEPETRTALAIECKYQGSAGSVDEKIPFALQDLDSMWWDVLVRGKKRVAL